MSKENVENGEKRNESFKAFYDFIHSQSELKAEIKALTEATQKQLGAMDELTGAIDDLLDMLEKSPLINTGKILSNLID